MRRTRIILLGLSGLLPIPIFGAEPTPIPDPVQDMLFNSCLECHDADTEKGDVNVEQ